MVGTPEQARQRPRRAPCPCLRGTCGERSDASAWCLRRRRRSGVRRPARFARNALDYNAALRFLLQTAPAARDNALAPRNSSHRLAPMTYADDASRLMKVLVG